MKEVKHINGQEYFFINGIEVSKQEFLTPTMGEIQAEFTAKIQTRLDDFARTRGYDGILSACTYANSNIPQFSAEGTKAVELRDLTWSTGYELLGKGLSFEEAESHLPELVW